MKRSDLYIKITTAVLFLAVVCYLCVYVYNAMLKTYETTPAILYTIEQTVSTQGYIVRSETVLSDSGLVVLPIVGEGEKVASGQAVAVEYLNHEALETASEIRSLRLMIEQFEASDGAAAVEAACLESVMNLSKAVKRGDLSRLDELALNVETCVFTDSAALASDLPALKSRLVALESGVAGVNTIYAPVSGTFSLVVDGFEYIGPSELFDISPAELTKLFSHPSAVSGAGKLVTDFKWYYAALVAADDASRFSEEQRVEMQFSGSRVDTMEMLIEHISKPDNNECVVLFSSDRSLHELTPLRQLRADVVLDITTGIRVPKEAIHLDDESKIFVYLQTGVRAERVDVEILSESGDSYLVRDGAETGTPLRAGATIIVKANDLFDGKIVG